MLACKLCLWWWLVDKKAAATSKEAITKTHTYDNQCHWKRKVFIVTHTKDTHTKHTHTSIAVLYVWTLTERGSHTPSSDISTMDPVSPSTPHVIFPVTACLAWGIMITYSFPCFHNSIPHTLIHSIFHTTHPESSENTDGISSTVLKQCSRYNLQWFRDGSIRPLTYTNDTLWTFIQCMC